MVPKKPLFILPKRFDPLLTSKLFGSRQFYCHTVFGAYAVHQVWSLVDNILADIFVCPMAFLEGRYVAVPGCQTWILPDQQIG
jgi:hypothetical protein